MAASPARSAESSGSSEPSSRLRSPTSPGRVAANERLIAVPRTPRPRAAFLLDFRMRVQRSQSADRSSFEQDLAGTFDPFDLVIRETRGARLALAVLEVDDLTAMERPETLRAGPVPVVYDRRLELVWIAPPEPVEDLSSGLRHRDPDVLRNLLLRGTKTITGRPVARGHGLPASGAGPPRPREGRRGRLGHRPGEGRTVRGNADAAPRLQRRRHPDRQAAERLQRRHRTRRRRIRSEERRVGKEERSR